MLDLKIGPISSAILLGGGPLLCDLSLWCAQNGLPVKVVTATRLADEKIGVSVLFSEFLTQNKIDHLVCETLDCGEAEEFLSDNDASFCLSIGAPWIVKEEMINNLFGGKLLNHHGTRLPQNKGGGGFSWQIMTANRFGSTAIHLVDKGVDTGDIIHIEEFLYPASCRIPLEFEGFHRSKCFESITQLLTNLQTRECYFTRTPQSQSFASYNPRLNTQLNGWLDWSFSAQEIERMICAFDEPYMGVQTIVNDEKVHLKSASINFQDQKFHPYQAGIIYRKAKEWICVASSGGSLIIERVLDKNGKSYLHELKEGDRFSTPYNYLEQSKRRVKYGPRGLVD